MITALEKRNLWHMGFFTLITLGFYSIYWIVVTKIALKKAGAVAIPTAILLIVPIANIYFLYKLAEGFSFVVFKDSPNQDTRTVAYLLLLLLLPIVAPFVMQYQINKALEPVRP